MLENFQRDSWSSIPPLRMPSLLPHDLCHGRSSCSRHLPINSIQIFPFAHIHASACYLLSFFQINFFNLIRGQLLYSIVMFFSHTSTWISHGCTCVPLSWTPLPPSSPHHPSGLSQSTGFECPASCIELALVIYFTYDNIYVSMLFFQIIPSLPYLT